MAFGSQGHVKGNHLAALCWGLEEAGRGWFSLLPCPATLLEDVALVGSHTPLGPRRSPNIRLVPR